MQISLAGWSIHRRFLSEQDPLKLIDFPRVAVEEFDINMVELNSPFFTYRDPESPQISPVAEGYLRDLKKAADDVACTVLSIAVDRHGDLAALDKAERKQAVENHKKWFQQIWSGIPGASTRNHPAPYPEELAERLIRMFSFVGDTVLDPFMGTGTTTIAAAKWGRNSIGIEIEPQYYELAEARIYKATNSLFSIVEIITEVKSCK